MPLFKVINEDDLKEYQCGQQLVAEGAAIYFNAQYGRTVGNEFTTQGIEADRATYVLVEQGRNYPRGLFEVRRIPLYYKKQ